MEPIGDRRGDLQAAIIASAVGGGRPSDRMIDWDEDLIQEVPIEDRIAAAMIAAGEAIRRRQAMGQLPKAPNDPPPESVTDVTYQAPAGIEESRESDPA